MARRRKKKKSLSGLGALALDPKIMLGGLVLIGVGVAAYFMLRKKDDEVVDPSQMVPADQMMPSSTGTPVPASSPATLIQKIQANPDVAAKLNTRQIVKPTSSLVKNLLNR